MTNQVRFVALLFPQVTQLDLTGPVQLFSRLPGATVDLAWHTLDPVPTDAGFSIVPTITFADAPPADVIMVPGGQGAFDLLDDEIALRFVREQARTARYVTSVCTGAFVLGAAGLLDGRRATTHWASHHLLPLVGAVPEHARVVRDGNVITGGGVTSGLDFALTVAAELYGDDAARRVQLTMEYDPHPPFDAGSPDRPQADPAQVEEARAAASASRAPVLRRVADRRRGPTTPGIRTTPRLSDLHVRRLVDPPASITSWVSSSVREDNGPFTVVTDLSQIDLDLVHQWLSTDAFWALDRTRDTVQRAAEASANFGVQDGDGRLCGYARVVTDRTTFAWLCDVYVDRAHRGLGLGLILARAVVQSLAPMHLKRVLLSTLDAHKLYEKVGFVPFPDPQKLMTLDQSLLRIATASTPYS